MNIHLLLIFYYYSLLSRPKLSSSSSSTPSPAGNYLVIECEEAESHRLNYHSSFTLRYTIYILSVRFSAYCLSSGDRGQR